MAVEKIPKDTSWRTHLAFAGLVATSALTAFDENLLKEAALLLAVRTGKAWLQGWSTIVFASPYVLFAAVAGWLADRFSKRTVLIWGKIIETVGMIVGAIGLVILNWPMLLATAGVMATVSVLLDPVVGGTVPEMYPDHFVTKANAIQRPVGAGLIFLGVALAGIFLDMSQGLWIIAGTIAATTLLGLAVAFLVRKRPAADPEAPVPWSGPWNSLKVLWSLRSDRLLAMILGADAWIWFMGSLEILVINYMGITQLHLGQGLTGLLVIAQVTGFALGGAAAVVLFRRVDWRRLAQIGFLVAGVFLGAIPLILMLEGAWQYLALACLLVLSGLGGGAVLVPSESFIQVRAGEKEKGKIIAAKYFLTFTGILFSGPLADLLYTCWTATTAMAILGGAALAGLVGVTLVARKISERARV